MNKKWYLNTWLIALLIALWPLYIPTIIGIILLILQYKTYGSAENILKTANQEVERLTQEKQYIKNKLAEMNAELNNCKLN